MCFPRLRVRCFVCVSFLFSLLAAFAPRAQAQTSFGTVAQGSSKSLAVTLTIPATGSFSTISVVTQGAANLDYTNAGGGTCVAGSTYASGSTCTVEVAFAPKHAGTRYGAVVLSNATGVVATAYLQGTGSGTLTQSLPGSTLLLASGFNGPYGVAADAGGNLYVADGTAVYKETPANGAYSQTSIGSGWQNAYGIAIDGAGNVYVTDGYVTSSPAMGRQALYKLAPLGASYAQSLVASGFAQISSVAVDGGGNVYATDAGTSTVASTLYKWTLGTGGFTRSTIGSGWKSLFGVAVDGSGDVDAADQTPDGLIITVETYSGGVYTPKPTTIGDSFSGYGNGPVAVDGVGNLYVPATYCSATQCGGSVLYVESPANSGYTQTAVMETGWSNPTGVAVDGSGDAFIADEGSHDLYEVYTGQTAATTMTVTANPSSPDWFQDVTITAAVTTAANQPVTSGSVVFNDGSGIVETANLNSAGQASFTASGNTYGSPYNGDGSFTFTASYGGTESFGASSGGVSVQWSYPQCPITFSPVAGTYTGPVTVTADAGPCIISGQSSSMNPSQETFLVSSTQTISVTAGANGYDNTTATAAYTIVPASSAAGTIATVAGNGTQGYGGDGGAATSAELSRPFGVASDSAGNLYIADTFNSRVRKVTPTGTIATYAGTGVAGASGDGGAATGAELYYPQTLAFDAAGNLYIADPPTNKVRKITPAGIISTYAGTGAAGHSGDGGAATSARLNYPAGVAVDASGNVYIAEANNEDIRKVTPAGTISTIAGTGTRGFAGDGGPATGAEFAQPGGLAMDAPGNLYVADQSNNRIRKITPTGTISTVAGNGTTGYSGDGGAATAAELNAPLGVAIDSAGNLYIADLSNSRVRKVNASGIISTLAGTGAQGFSGDGGAAASAALYDPFGLGVDASGNVYIADTDNNRIRKVTETSTVATPAATPVFSPSAGTYTSAQTVTITDATASAAIYYTTNGTTPTTGSTKYTGAITVSATETIEAIAVATGYANSAVATAAYTITPPAATPVFSPAAGTYTGAQTVTITDATSGATIYYTTNGTAPTTSSTRYTGAITVSSTETIEAIAVATGSSNSAVATSAYTISAATAPGTITTVAGNGTAGYTGNGGAATGAELDAPAGVSTDASGNFYIADYASNTIRKVTVATGILATVAGSDSQGYAGDGGPATGAKFYGPQYGAEDAAGNIYIADQVNCRIRKVTAATGIVSTVAGNGSCGFSGDGGAATSAELSDPYGVAVDASGNLYIADTYNHRIRKVNASGAISTIAGTGVGGYNGDNMAATGAELHYPWGVSVDASGNLYIADWYNERVRKVTSSGTITTLAGTGTAGFSGDGGAATSALLNSPQGVWADASGNVYIADTSNQRIRKVNAAGVISTVAGDGTKGFSGDGGAATAAALNTPQSVAADASGNLYIADIGNNRIRKVSAGGATAPAATPAFSLPGGTYTGALSVTIADATPGATIYYTTNGTAPTTSSTKYTGALSIPATPGLTETIEAIAVAPGYTNSAVATASYSILPPAATPVISPASGTYPTAQTVTITDATAGATLYYTTNGSVPTTSSTKYTGPITVSASETIEAKAVATGYSLSSPAVATYTIAPPAATPVFSPAGGSYTSAQTVTISDATAVATIYYTTNGTAPTSSSTRYTGPITVGVTETLEAIAAASGDTNSAVATAAYTIVLPVSSGTITTVAGNGTSGYTGNGGAATGAEVAAPDGVGADAAGNFYIADTYNAVVRKVTPSGIISVVAGNGTTGYSGDGGLATSAEINYPTGVAVDSSGNLYISDANNNRIRKVSASGTISTVAGNGIAGYSGDGGPATGAELKNPAGVALDASGNLYIADWNNNVVRKVTPSGTISTVAGTGARGFSGDGGPATSAELDYPYGVAVDAAGDLYIADSTNFRVRKVTAAGVISTVAGTGTNGFSGDGGPGASAALSYVNSVALDPSGNLFIADSGNSRVRVLLPNGTIATAVGTGVAGYSGDGGPAIGAKLHGENGLAFDASGNLLIADTQNSAIRKVTFGAAAPPVLSPGGGTYATAQTVTIADATAGATIHYTTDGTAPTTSSPVYTGPITVSASAVVKALAAGSGFSASPVASAAFTIEVPAATPVFSPAGGSYTSIQTVTIADTTPGATIYYTTNGTTPTTSSTKYTGAITVGQTETLAAIAVAPGYTNSGGATAAYTITLPAATPAISPAGGSYTSIQTVTIADATAGATIYYTTNGTAPTTASAKYTGPITVGATETLEAIATAPGYSTSAVATAAYTISLTAAAPTFSVGSGTYESVQTVTLASTTPGAILYYTTNGTAPATSSTKYTGAIAVSSTETLEAIAVATGYANSPVASASYTIAGSPTALAESATAVTSTSATLNALVNLQGLTGSYYFAYGTSSASLTSSTATVSLSTQGTVPVSAALTGLTPGTTYYFKVVATTAGGSASGAILSF